MSVALVAASGELGLEAFLPPPFEAGESRMQYSKRASTLLKEKLGIDERGEKSLDVVVDASGAEVCVQMALLIEVHGTRGGWDHDSRWLSGI